MKKQIKKLRMPGKTTAHGKSITRSLIIELVRAEKIKTTPLKAKIVKSRFDRLVSLAKRGDSGKKMIDSFFASNDKIIKRFYKVVEEQLQDRNSGYTRLIRTLPRKGDNAQQVYIMLINIAGKEVKSEVQKVLEKQAKTAEKKSIGGKLKKVVKKVTKTK